jgi:hypothetical protein
MALRGAGFSTPVVQADAARAIDLLVTSVVADLCHAANSSGRLFTEKVVARGLSPMILVNQQIGNWVKEWTTALKQLGVPWSPTGEELVAFSVPAVRQL